MGFGLAKSAAVLAVSMSDRRNLENQAEGYGGVASARTHIRNVISAQCFECQSEEIRPSAGKRRE